MKKIYFLAACCLAMCLSACSGDGNKGTENGHEWVDLGLPSGTMWATCNIGATKPEEFGDYYAWGETATKSTYDYSTYKYDSELGKNGFTDNKTTLDLSDDAAYVNWGGKWRMPTHDQQEELVSQCCWVWTESYNNSNVKGYIVYKAKNSSDKGVKICEGGAPSSSYSLSDAHIFLPAAGFRYDGAPHDYRYAHRDGGYYWSSSLYVDNSNYAWYVSFDSDGVYHFEEGDVCSVGSDVGLSVRPVRK